MIKKLIHKFLILNKLNKKPLDSEKLIYNWLHGSRYYKFMNIVNKKNYSSQLKLLNGYSEKDFDDITIHLFKFLNHCGSLTKALKDFKFALKDFKFTFHNEQKFVDFVMKSVYQTTLYEKFFRIVKLKDETFLKILEKDESFYDDFPEEIQNKKIIRHHFLKLGGSLESFDDWTLEERKIAIENNAENILLVDTPTLSEIKIALKNDPKIIYNILRSDFLIEASDIEICEYASKCYLENGKIIKDYLSNYFYNGARNYNIYKNIFTLDGSQIKWVEYGYLDEELILLALKSFDKVFSLKKVLKFLDTLKNKTDFFLQAIKTNPSCLKDIPTHMRNYEIYALAIKLDFNTIRYIQDPSILKKIQKIFIDGDFK